MNLASLCSATLLAGIAFMTPHAARADYLSIAVTVTCDQTHNRALVRFGYGDAGTPYFATFADPAYGPLSKQPTQVKNNEQDEAKCKLSDGRIVYVKKTSKPSRFNVYVGGKKVVRDHVLFSNVGNGSGLDPVTLPFSVEIGPEGVRVCYFLLREDDWVYQLIDESAPPVDCNEPDE